MKVLVTGASGFVGRTIVTHLAAEGHAVRAAARDPSRVPALAAERCVLPDLAHPFDASSLLAGMDAVVHSAGMAHQPAAVGEQQLNRINAEATGELARAAAAAGVKAFVLISSIRAISGPSSATPLAEDAPALPTDAYGRSKLAGEDAVRAAFPAATILRPPAVHGAGARGNMDRLATLARTGLPVPLGGLAGRHSIVSDLNLASASAFCLTTPATAGETFHVDDGAALSLAEIVGTMRVALGRPARLVTLPRPLATIIRRVAPGSLGHQLTDGLTVSSDKLREKGWQPPETSAAGLTRLVRALA